MAEEIWGKTVQPARASTRMDSDADTRHEQEAEARIQRFVERAESMPVRMSPSAGLQDQHRMAHDDSSLERLRERLISRR